MEIESSFPALAAALRERLAVIADQELRRKDPAAQLERLKAVSEKIAALQSQLPPDIHPRLRHFLEGCSYDKALAFLEENYPGVAASRK